MTPSRAVAAASRLVEVWRTFPPGTAVIVRRDDGSTFETKTRSLAYLLGGQTPVVDIAASLALEGPWALSRVSLAATKTSKAEGRGDATQGLAPSLTPVRDMPGWQEGDSSASPPNALLRSVLEPEPEPRSLLDPMAGAFVGALLLMCLLEGALGIASAIGVGP